MADPDGWVWKPCRPSSEPGERVLDGDLSFQIWLGRRYGPPVDRAADAAAEALESALDDDRDATNEDLTKKEMAARLSAVEALADKWTEWARTRSTHRIDAFRDAAEDVRAILEGRDHA